jgi:hypothetical protein
LCTRRPCSPPTRRAAEIRRTSAQAADIVLRHAVPRPGHGPRRYVVPGYLTEVVDGGDPLQRRVAQVLMDLVEHRIRAPHVQGVGRIERHVGLLGGLGGRGTGDEVVTQRSQHSGEAHRGGDPGKGGGQQVPATFLAGQLGDEFLVLKVYESLLIRPVARSR